MNAPRSVKGLGRGVGDDYVDRRQVQAWQHVQPSRTNPPCGLTGALSPVSTSLQSKAQQTTKHTGRNTPAFPSDSCTLSHTLHPHKTTSMVGGSSAGDTPVPIPNTAVKPRSADGTAEETRWESTSPPAFVFLAALAPEGVLGRFVLFVPERTKSFHGQS